MRFSLTALRWFGIAGMVLAAWLPATEAGTEEPRRVIKVPSRGAYATIDTAGMKHALAVFSGSDEKAKDALLERIKARPGDFASPVFFLVAQRLAALRDPEGASFWFWFGMLRASYDAARCADATARSGVYVLANSTKPEIRRHFTQMPAESLVRFSQKVLQLDADTPYNYDHRWICLHGMEALTEGTKDLCLPEAQWPGIREANRKGFLEGFGEAAVASRKRATPATNP